MGLRLLAMASCREVADAAASEDLGWRPANGAIPTILCRHHQIVGLTDLIVLSNDGGRWLEIRPVDRVERRPSCSICQLCTSTRQAGVMHEDHHPKVLVPCRGVM